jgi:hypothetical protein
MWCQEDQEEEEEDVQPFHHDRQYWGECHLAYLFAPMSIHTGCPSTEMTEDAV